MTKIQVLAFGIAKDIVGGSKTEVSINQPQTTVAALKTALIHQFPQFSDLKSLAIAVNESYADDNQIINPNDEVVLIPPVSGG